MKYLKSYFVISLLRISIHVHVGKFVKLVIKPFGIRKIDLEESFRGVFNNICKNLKVLRFCCFPTGHRTFRRRPGNFLKSYPKCCVDIHIDLSVALSERAESTGATGDRLKEGAAINQSLSSLGNVIAGESVALYKCSV